MVTTSRRRRSLNKKTHRLQKYCSNWWKKCHIFFESRSKDKKNSLEIGADVSIYVECYSTYFQSSHFVKIDTVDARMQAYLILLFYIGNIIWRCYFYCNRILDDVTMLLVRFKYSAISISISTIELQKLGKIWVYDQQHLFFRANFPIETRQNYIRNQKKWILNTIWNISWHAFVVWT